MKKKDRPLVFFVLVLLCSCFVTGISLSAAGESDIARLVGAVVTDGQQMKYLSLLSDEIGSRLTGSPGAERAVQATEGEMKRIGLANVRREPFDIPVSWERGPARALLASHGNRALAVASYTWAPGTSQPVESKVMDVGAGRPEDLQKVRDRLKGSIALATPRGATLDETIGNFYRTPLLAREVADAGAAALLIASDRPHAMPYTAPVDFNARLAALPTLSVAREDVSLIQRMLREGREVLVRLDVRNNVGRTFQSFNVVGEIPGREQPDEIVVIGAHLDSNDLGPGALDNAAGCAAVLEAARAIRSLGLTPRRTLRFVLFMGEEQGMLGSNAYVRRHRDEMDRTVACLIMDIGAGKPQGWLSMGRTDLDAGIRKVMGRLDTFGMSQIEHAAFAATDNAAFMAEGVPNLVMLQDGSSYFPLLHTIADTPDKVDPRDFAACVAVLAAAAYEIADSPDRLGRRLAADEVRKIAAETKVDEQWRAAGIWQK